MPACTLYCEDCHSEQVKDLDDLAFGNLLEEGVALVACEGCARTTRWKLKLRRSEERSKAPSKALRILIVDDDPDTLRVLSKMLTASGYKADLASSADEAMYKLEDKQFDVIVSDILMPGFSGPNLFRFLNVFMPEYVAKVVFLTGDRSEKTLEFLEESGCPYTFKPINLEELKARIAEVS